MEGDCLSFDLAFLDINFVASEHDWDLLADANKITCDLQLMVQILEVAIRTMPIGYVLVCDSRCNVEHDDTALTIDVVAIS